MNALLASLERDPSRIRNRWLGAGATAVVVVVAVLGAIGVRNRRPPLCPSSKPLLAGVWDDARKDAMGEAFRRTRKPYAEDALRGVRTARSIRTRDPGSRCTTKRASRRAFGGSSRAS